MAGAIATVIAALIAALTSLIAARSSARSKSVSEEVERRFRIRQARMDERDLILREGGFLIPIEQDNAWRDYYATRSTDPKVSRKEASENIQLNIPESSDPRVAERLAQ